MTESEATPVTYLQRLGRSRLRRWAQLVTGEILTAGGLGWCLRPAFKEHPNKWTTFAVFVVVSTGISLTRSAVKDAYIYYRALSPPVYPRLRNLVLTEPEKLPEGEGELFAKAVDRLSTLANKFDRSAGKCYSCKDLIETLYRTLLQFTEDIKSNKDSPPQLYELLKRASNEYKARHGYPDVVTTYRKVMPDRCIELFDEISLVLRIRKKYVDYLIKQPPMGGRNILNLSDKCLSEFLLCADINKELRIKIADMTAAVLVLFEEDRKVIAKEFINFIRKIPDPFISCKGERKLVKVLENVLYYTEHDVK